MGRNLRNSRRSKSSLSRPLMASSVRSSDGAASPANESMLCSIRSCNVAADAAVSERSSSTRRSSVKNARSLLRASVTPSVNAARTSPGWIVVLPTSQEAPAIRPSAGPPGFNRLADPSAQITAGGSWPALAKFNSPLAGSSTVQASWPRFSRALASLRSTSSSIRPASAPACSPRLML